MKSEAQNFLVLLLDEADHRTLTQMVRAANALDAEAYALRFDSFGEAREDGYEVLLVLSVNDLKDFTEELGAFTGPVAQNSDSSNLELESGFVVSD